MTRKTRVWLLAGMGVVLPLLWLITAPSEGLFRMPEFPLHLPKLPPRHAEEPTPTTTDTRTFTEPPPRELNMNNRQVIFPDWVFWLLSALFLTVVVVALAVVTWRWLTGIRKTVEVEDTDLVGETQVPDSLVTQPEVFRTALVEGTPRNAIVACWAALEDATRDAHVPILPHETSSEYTERVVGTWVGDPTALRSLAELYREARFSQHDLTEAARTAATAFLDELLGQLRHSWEASRAKAHT